MACSCLRGARARWRKPHCAGDVPRCVMAPNPGSDGGLGLAGRVWGWWVRASFLAVCLVVWPLVTLTPGAWLADRAARLGARAWLWLARIPVRASGGEALRSVRRPCVLVSNHTSKLDAIVLLAALPVRFAFVAKSELAGPAWLRWPLRRLGTLFVERDRREHSGSATKQAIARLRAGGSLLFFPEGTFGDEPGLLAFHSGAFVAAVSAGCQVIPVALRGTRDVLPDLHRLPRRGRVEVRVGAAIDVDRDRPVSEQALAVRCAARAFVASHCGEPDVAPPGVDAPTDAQPRSERTA